MYELIKVIHFCPVPLKVRLWTTFWLCPRGDPPPLVQLSPQGGWFHSIGQQLLGRHQGLRVLHRSPQPDCPRGLGSRHVTYAGTHWNRNNGAQKLFVGCTMR